MSVAERRWGPPCGDAHDDHPALTPRYLAAVPTARFVPLLGAGHAPQSDTPDAILQLVRRAGAAARPALPAAA